MKYGLRARCVRFRLAVGAAATLTLGLSAAPAAARPLHDIAACARPALWVVNDADTTIYLFGTIHTHDGRAHWFDHAVKRAFEASDTLVLETIVPASLPSVVAPAAPGLSAARATAQTARTIGLSVRLGADQVLQRAADAGGKPVIGLESFAEQLRMYQQLPSPAQPNAGTNAAPSLAGDPRLAIFLRSMVDNWNRGDPAQIEAVVGSVQLQSPAAYRRLFSDRNETWAKWIGARLKRPGTIFLAVGTGHLVGTDSVQAKLAAVGVKSARVS